MKLSITRRLTLTTAMLTLAFFVPAGAALYLAVASGIHEESARRAETAARGLVYAALSQWDDDLMVENKNRAAPFTQLQLPAVDWALARGDGRLVTAQGDLFAGHALPAPPGTSLVLEKGGATYRLGSVPLFPANPPDLADLPAPVVDAVRKQCPEATFLCAQREAKSGGTATEVLLLKDDTVLELEVTDDGSILETDADPLEPIVPLDLLALLAGEAPLAGVALTAWHACRGQLVATLAVTGAGGETTTVAVNRLGERFFLDAAGLPTGVDPATRLWMTTATDASAEGFATGRLLATLVLGLPVLWSAVVLVGWYVTRRALSPVKRIVETVERIGVSHLDERLPVGSVEDELSRISKTINTMLERIEEGYKRERRFTGDASHELRGPLAKVLADIDVALSRERDASEYRATLVRCRSYGCDLQRLIESLLCLARLDADRGAPRRHEFDLTDLAAEIARRLPADQARRTRLDLGDGGDVVTAYAAPDLVSVMIRNLLQNALRYSPCESTVTLRLRRHNGCARVEIDDRGEGVPRHELERVFARFYRADRSRSRATGGFGLGLAIVNEIAAAHGATVTLENLRAGGMRAAFSLPAEAAASS